MSTLAEIEAAIEKLPPPEQEKLFAHLSERLPSLFVLQHDPVKHIAGMLEDEPGYIGRNAEEILYGRSKGA